MRELLILGAVIASVAPFAEAEAAFSTMDISSYVNSNISIMPNSYPTGISTGNQGAAIPFNLATFGANGYTGVWLAQGQASPGTSPTLTVDLTGQNITGQQSFYALLNNYFGTAGANEYNVTVMATNGDSVTYQSIGGADTRDYNENPNTAATIAGTTTPWFANGQGQRLDVRQFVLPTSFLTETLSSFRIDQVNANDPAMFAGVTFSTDPASFAVPEPASLALMGAGLAGLGLARRRRRAA